MTITVIRALGSLCLAAQVLSAADFDLTPEVHSFVSFGYLQTTENEWLGSSTSRSSDFWEVAANVALNPVPTVRVAGQLFARDFQRYDNGRAQLDWLYGEWHPKDVFGLQLGRVKIPAGLFNEVRDVDAARATVFLATSVYALRTRDLYNATDGAKALGFCHLGPAGSIEYSAYLGKTHLSLDGGFSSYLTDAGFGEMTELGIDYVWGGMLHWHTPVSGLGTRFTANVLKNLTGTGTLPSGVVLHAQADTYLALTPSVIYELGPLTLVTEALFTRGENSVQATDANGFPVAPLVVQKDHNCGGYVSGSWQFPIDVETTIAVERQWDDVDRLDVPNTTRFSLAARWGITNHWSVKAEYQRIVGAGLALPADNPDGVKDHWDLFALKTTIDF
jgi:hypothetical protein